MSWPSFRSIYARCADAALDLQKITDCSAEDITSANADHSLRMLPAACWKGATHGTADRRARSTLPALAQCIHSVMNHDFEGYDAYFG